MAGNQSTPKGGRPGIPKVPTEAFARRRRTYPRIRLNQPAPVRLANGDVAENCLHDVSRGGVQLRADRKLAAAIHPSQTVIKEGDWPTIELGITFPYPAGIPEIVVQCTIRYVRVVESGRFAFGLMFLSFAGDGAAHFERFIEESLRPSTP